MHDERVEEWILKAEEDYKSVIRMNPMETPNVICFHCQQCIEKYLKAFLVANGETPPITHNLIRLNNLAEKYEKSFEEIYDLLEELNPYSVLIRYPGIIATPDDAKKSVNVMKDLRKKLKNFLENKDREVK
jgi:HEPN domain-containing protein